MAVNAMNELMAVTTGTLPEWSSMARVRSGITGARWTDLVDQFGDAHKVIVKVSAMDMTVEAEVLAYAVSTLSPGLVDIPATALRQTADGRTVSVQYWRDGGMAHTDLSTSLRSDIVGMAAYDYIVHNADRHPGNAVQVPTGHHHHDRLVAIDHGAAFMTQYPVDTRFAVGHVSGARVPHYIHDHMARIVAGADSLIRTGNTLGMGGPAADVIDRADLWQHAQTFPTVRRRHVW